jgi:hypothetical protein
VACVTLWQADLKSIEKSEPTTPAPAPAKPVTYSIAALKPQAKAPAASPVSAPVASKVCSQCHAVATGKFCQACGGKVVDAAAPTPAPEPPAKTCSGCHAALEPTVKFCPACGGKAVPASGPGPAPAPLALAESAVVRSPGVAQPLTGRAARFDIFAVFSQAMDAAKLRKVCADRGVWMEALPSSECVVDWCSHTWLALCCICLSPSRF